jgi:hypothetical protein
MTESPTPDVPVTRADLDAAESYIKASYREWHIGIGAEYVRTERIALRLADDDYLVQAFARHRLATASEPTREAPTAPAESERDAEIERLRAVVTKLSNALTRHHQWHAAQTEPDPEHGFIPAAEYAESSLHEQTVKALSANAAMPSATVSQGSDDDDQS